MTITRRTFNCAAVAVAATAMRPTWLHAQPMGFPLGLQLYTVREVINQDTPSALKQVAGLGYKEVETAGFGTLKTASEFRRVLDDMGLRCPSAHLQFDLANLNKTFDDANALGCTYATASVPRNIFYKPAPRQRQSLSAASGMLSVQVGMPADQFPRMVDVLNEIGRAARSAGLRYASHNHAMEFSLIDGKTGYEYVIDNTDPETVFFELDCGWASVAGQDPAAIMRRHPGRIKMLHLSDYKQRQSSMEAPREPAEGVLAGKGITNFVEIFDAARDLKIEHAFVEEAAATHPMEAAKLDREYLLGIGR